MIGTGRRAQATVASTGSWQGRPAGLPGAVPPPSVPLSFLAAAALGLVACGVAWAWASGAAATDPTGDHVVAAAHLGLLAALSMGVLGAVHQFVPVISQRPLRSVRLARATFVAWLGGSWLLPLGIGAAYEPVVEAGGALAALAIGLLVANMSHALAARGKGAPVTGLRFALAGFVATACYGLVYVADRRGKWFDLAGHVVLAHAVVGLFAWLGLTYVAVAEKLWPMFFLAHVPDRHRWGRVAVWAVPAGVALLSPGLLAGVAPLAAAGAVVLASGLASHLASLSVYVRHRRRKPDLHLLFVLTSAAWLPVGAVLALVASVVMASHHHAGTALVAAAVAAGAGWLLEALVGHLFKVVPFIGWAALRGRGVDKAPGGKPLLFADLYDHTWAAVSYGLLTCGLVALCTGLAASLPAATAAGGGLLALTAPVVGVNLALRPARLLRAPVAVAPVP